jgi:hypothetical protein
MLEGEGAGDVGMETKQQPHLDNGDKGGDSHVLEVVVVRPQEAAHAACGKLNELRAREDGGDRSHAFIHDGWAMSTA